MAEGSLSIPGEKELNLNEEHQTKSVCDTTLPNLPFSAGWTSVTMCGPSQPSILPRTPCSDVRLRMVRDDSERFAGSSWSRTCNPLGQKPIAHHEESPRAHRGNKAELNVDKHSKGRSLTRLGARGWVQSHETDLFLLRIKSRLVRDTFGGMPLNFHVLCLHPHVFCCSSFQPGAIESIGRAASGANTWLHIWSSKRSQKGSSSTSVHGTRDLTP